MAGISGSTSDLEGRPAAIDTALGGASAVNEDQTIRGTLDGEIYNRARLRRLLGERGHRLATDGDAEILVHLYEEYGEELVHALDGTFAFAIWDSRERPRLLLGRDRFGERPLFYASGSGRELAFGSDQRPLPAVVGIAAELDPCAVERFFLNGYVPGEISMVGGVRSLMPGHLLAWRPGEGEPVGRRYWKLPTPIDVDAETEADVVRELDHLLSVAVGSRLAGDSPVGVLLDGGLASTLIAAVAARDSGAPVKSFAVAARDGDPPILAPGEIVARVPSILAALDRPVGEPSFPLLRALAEHARTEVPVVLGGEGAEELFGAAARDSRSASPATDEPGAWRSIYGPRLPHEADQAPVDPLGRLSDDKLVAADLAGEQIGLQIRRPYLGYELAEFAATVSSPSRDGGGKWLSLLLSKLTSKAAPRRPATPMRPPTADWLRGPLAPILRGQLDRSAVAEGWLDRGELGRLIDEHKHGADHGAVLWRALAFGLWLDRRQGDGDDAD